MGRKKLEKTRIQVKIDTKLKQILDSMKIDKSAYINQMLYKELLLSQFPTHQSPKTLQNILYKLEAPIHSFS